METNFPKKYLCSWVTGSFEVPEEKFNVQSSGRKCDSSNASPDAYSKQDLSLDRWMPRKPQGTADITSIQLSKCPYSSSKSESQFSKCERDEGQDTSNVCFSFGSKPKTFEPET